MNQKLKEVTVAAVLVLIVSAAANASPTTCSGKIWKIWKDQVVTWIEIGHGLYQCSVNAESTVGKRILSVCNLGSRCTFHVEVAPRTGEEMEGAGETVLLGDRDRLLSVRRGAADDSGAKGFFDASPLSRFIGFWSDAEIGCRFLKQGTLDKLSTAEASQFGVIEISTTQIDWSYNSGTTYCEFTVGDARTVGRKTSVPAVCNHKGEERRENISLAHVGSKLELRFEQGSYPTRTKVRCR